MTILERYIWKNVLLSILLALFSLVLLDTFFSFLNELNDVKPNSRYGSLQAFIYTLMGAPKQLYSYLPTATLIGSLLGLGNLAAQRELTAIRAAGISIRQIVMMVLKLGVVLMVVAFVLGEWVAPRTDQAATSFKLQMQQKQLSVGSQGIWLKENQRIINITKMWSDNQLEGLSIYTIDAKAGRIQTIEKAASATKQGQTWTLFNFKRQIIHERGLEQQVLPEFKTSELLPENVLGIAAVKPNQLAAVQLAEFIAHQKANDLNSERFEQAFWQHFTTPLSTLVMLVLATPFVFGSQRDAGAGQRLFVGILIGIGFFLLNRILGNVGVVYGLPPLLAAGLPLVLFLVAGVVLIKRVR